MNPASPFQIGDHVEIIGPDDHGFGHTIGEKFQITQINRPDAPFQWASCRGRAIYPTSSLCKIDELHVGDYVKVLRRWHAGEGGTNWGDDPLFAEKVGKIGRIVERDQERSGWIVDIDGDAWDYPEFVLQKVDGPELQKGDWVEVIGPAAYFRQCDTKKTFRVTKMPDECRDILGLSGIAWAGDYYSDADVPMYPASSLRKLAPEEVAEHTGTIGHKMQECASELEEAMEALRDVLAPIVDERLSAIEKNYIEDCQFRAKFNCDVKERLLAIESLQREQLEKIDEVEERLLRNLPRISAMEGLRKESSIEKRQAQQNSMDAAEKRMDRFLQDYRGHKDFCLRLHDRISATESKIKQFDGEIGSLRGDIGDLIIDIGDVEARTKCREIEIGKRLAFLEKWQMEHDLEKSSRFRTTSNVVGKPLNGCDECEGAKYVDLSIDDRKEALAYAIRKLRMPDMKSDPKFEHVVADVLEGMLEEVKK